MQLALAHLTSPDAQHVTIPMSLTTFIQSEVEAFLVFNLSADAEKPQLQPATYSQTALARLHKAALNAATIRARLPLAGKTYMLAPLGIKMLDKLLNVVVPRQRSIKSHQTSQ